LEKSPYSSFVHEEEIMQTVNANGIEIYYEITGNGPPLTLIMGLGCSARQWEWMVPLLAKSFQIITYDNRGVGRTSKPDMEYTTDLFAEDTCALLNTLGIKKSHIFGVSVGGMIAQKFALKYPEMVNRLVLGCTMPNFHHLPPTTEVLQRMQESQLFPPDESVEVMLRLFLTEQFFARKPDQAAKLKEVMLIEKKEQGQDAFLRQMGAAMNHNTQDEIKNIKAPTLMITGDLDPMAPVENAHFLAEHIPNSTLAELPGVQHAFWVERFKEACDIINRFLCQ
jgi:pimeloyl-ACP methyl ester carboxylesterase